MPGGTAREQGSDLPAHSRGVLRCGEAGSDRPIRSWAQDAQSVFTLFQHWLMRELLPSEKLQVNLVKRPCPVRLERDVFCSTFSF